MTKKITKVRIDFPSPPADDGQRRRNACRIAVSHQLLQKRA
jgi:hypothetical protein